MRLSSTLFLLLAGLSACRGVSRSRDSATDAQIVALAVRSEPSGAKVRVNRIERTWMTPCDVADLSLTKGLLDVELSLEGYETYKTQVRYDGGEPAQLSVRLVSRRPAPEAAKAPVPAAKAATPEPSAPATLYRLEPVQGGTRLTLTQPRTRVRIQAKQLMTDLDRPGIYFLANVPPEKVILEFIDPSTDAVLLTAEIPAGQSPAAAAPQVAPAPVYAPAAAPAPVYAPVAAPQYYPVPAAAPQYYAPAPAAPQYYQAPAQAYAPAPAPQYYQAPPQAYAPQAAPQYYQAPAAPQYYQAPAQPYAPQAAPQYYPAAAAAPQYAPAPQYYYPSAPAQAYAPQAAPQYYAAPAPAPQYAPPPAAPYYAPAPQVVPAAPQYATAPVYVAPISQPQALPQAAPVAPPRAPAPLPMPLPAPLPSNTPAPAPLPPPLPAPLPAPGSNP